MVSNSSTPSQRFAPEAKPYKDLALTCLLFHDAPPSWFAVLYFQIFRVAISSFGSIQILYNQPDKHAVHKVLEVHRPHRLLAPQGSGIPKAALSFRPSAEHAANSGDLCSDKEFYNSLSRLEGHGHRSGMAAQRYRRFETLLQSRARRLLDCTPIRLLTPA